MAKITDTIRILVGLRDGCRLNHELKTKFSGTHYFDEGDVLHHPDGERRISIRYATIMKVVEAGRIERGPETGYREHPWLLTDAGQAAATALPEIPIDDLFLVSPATPREALETARNRRLAKKALRS